MDYTLNSSDILFPGDSEIPKLTSPMHTKIPQGIDWANQDLMNTFTDKSSQDIACFMSLRNRIKLCDDTDYIPEYNFGPLNTREQHSDEKKLYCQALPSNYPLDKKEIHEIVKDIFNMVQNDIQKNAHGYPPYFVEPFLSWKEEIWNDSNAIGSIGDISGFEPKLAQKDYHQHRRPSPSSYRDNNIDILEELPVANPTQLIDESNTQDYTASLPTKDRKTSSKPSTYFKKRGSNKPLKTFYKKAKKNIKAITSKLLHV